MNKVLMNVKGMPMQDYERFKELIKKKTGIDLSCYKEKQMKRRIGSLVQRNKFISFQGYYNALIKDDRLYNEFINYITINVSDFYRNQGQWEILEREIIPGLLSKKSSLKIWSSACSTGEEPYSLVMLLTKFMDLDRIKIFATDIDRQAIEKAKMGVYREQSLKNLPQKFINKFFVGEKGLYKISENIKKRVEFSCLNLLSDDYPIECDLILCRNVLIYFTEQAKEEVYNKFYNALNNEGVLFVGSTEQIIMPQKHNFLPAQNFFYRKL